MTLIERVEARISELEAQKKRVVDELDDIAENRTQLSAAAADQRIKQLRARGEEINVDLAEARARLDELNDKEQRLANAYAVMPKAGWTRGVSVRSEPGIYRPDGEVGFFADMARRAAGDPDAHDRLMRHQRGELRVRENRDITTGTLNGLVPPRYLLDAAADLARAGAPFWEKLPSSPLPPDGMTLYVSRITTGALTLAQTAQNTGVAEQNIVTTDLSIPVVSISGVQDVSRQVIERGAQSDRLIFADLMADWYMRRDYLAINGTGSNGQPLGIANVTSTNTASWTGTTISSFYTAMGGALNAVASNRFSPASIALMHPRRWFWLCEQADTTGRPMVGASNVSVNPIATWSANAAEGVVGTLMGVPVVLDANVPTTLSASSNQDVVIVSRLEDHIAWQDPQSPVQLTFNAYPSAPEQYRLAAWGYMACTFERQPKGTTILTGTGLSLTP